MGSCPLNQLVLPYTPSSRIFWLKRKAEWLTEDSIIVPTWKQHPERMGSALENAVYILNQRPINDAVFLIVRIHSSRNQWVEVGVASLTSTPTYPPWEFFFHILATLSSAGLEIIVSTRLLVPLGDTTMVLLIWKTKLPPGHFELLI